MEQKKVYHVILDEAEITALGNLNIILMENKEGLASLQDQCDCCGDSLWATVETLLTALQSVVVQLPM